MKLRDWKMKRKEAREGVGGFKDEKVKYRLALHSLLMLAV